MDLTSIAILLRKHKTLASVIVACSGITAASMAMTASLQSNAIKPLPVLTVKHRNIDDDTWVDVHIGQGTRGPLRDLNYKHNHLDCLHTKGYSVRSVVSGGFEGDEPILVLRNNKKSYDDFVLDCKACSVNTDISVEGCAPKKVHWASHTFTK